LNASLPAFPIHVNHFMYNMYNLNSLIYSNIVFKPTNWEILSRSIPGAGLGSESNWTRKAGKGANGWPWASTGNGVLPVVSTPMPATGSGLKPRTLFFASAIAF
jgi:hypothetical protein